MNFKKVLHFDIYVHVSQQWGAVKDGMSGFLPFGFYVKKFNVVLFCRFKVK